jgi:hypothetical protein
MKKPPLARPRYCYEYYNPWSGFNPCTLAEAFRWLKATLTLRARTTNTPSSLAIYDRAGKTILAWDGRDLVFYGGGRPVRRTPFPAAWQQPAGRP